MKSIGKRSKLIVVLGMHRSGTSAVTRGLQVFGVQLGDCLLPPVENDNKKGYWEDVEIHALNEELLREINNAWYSHTPISVEDVEMLCKKGYSLRALELIREKVGNAQVFAFKDPSVAKLLPFWKEVFARCEFEVSYIVVLRHPLSVVNSLANRGLGDVRKGFYLWLQYVIACSMHTQGKEHLFVDFDRLIRNPKRELDRVSKQLKLKIIQSELKNYQSDFLDEALRHSFFNMDDLTQEDTAPELLKEVYAALINAASDKIDINGSKFKNQVKKFNAELKPVIPILIQTDYLGENITARDEQIDNLNQELAERDKLIHNRNKVLAQRDGQIDKLQQSAGKSVGQIDNLNQELAERDKSVHNRNLVLAKRDRQVTKLDQRIADLVNISDQSSKKVELLSRENVRLEYLEKFSREKIYLLQKDIDLIGASWFKFAAHALRRIIPFISPSFDPPLLSLLMPTAVVNAGEIERTLASLPPQKRGYEIVLCGQFPEGLQQNCMLQFTNAGGHLVFAKTPNTVESATALNCGLTLSSGKYVGVINPGDELSRDAIDLLTHELYQSTHDVIYTDEQINQDNGESITIVEKPDWSPEFVLSYPYTGRLCLFRREKLFEWGGWRADTVLAEDYDLILRAEKEQASICHLRRNLYVRHRKSGDSLMPYSSDAEIKARRTALERFISCTDLQADVVSYPGPTHLRVIPNFPESATISIIIPTRDCLSFLRQCIDSISQYSCSNTEIIIVDNDSVEDETLKYFSDCGHKVIRYPGEFNFSAINNAGAIAATGEVLIFLNNDTEVINPGWINALCEWALLPEIGCVGAKLVFPNGKLQHVGVTLHHGSAHHPCYGQYPGIGNSFLDTDTIRNYSAVTAACMAVRHSVFDEVGGFDEKFPVAYNDVDLCLRIKASGYRNIYTPYAQLLHHESASRKAGVEDHEIEQLKATHQSAIAYDEFSCEIGYEISESRSQPTFLNSFGSQFKRVWQSSISLFGLMRESLHDATPLVKFSDAQRTPSNNQDDYIRWVNQISIGNKTYPALFMHPESSHKFKLEMVPKRARLCLNIALQPEAWTKNVGGVTFIVSISGQGELLLNREWRVNPSKNKTDRQWKSISVPLSLYRGMEIEIELETMLSPGAQPAYAWAVWGNPLIATDKSILEAIRNQIDEVRRNGVRSVFRNWYRQATGQVLLDSEYSIWLLQDDQRKEKRRRLIQQDQPFAYQPLISILTPTYNTDPMWLRRCVESVLAQSYSNWELYLSDDGSNKPATLSCLQELSDKDSRIHFIRSEKNKGISAATNKALKKCSGEYVGLLDHDDEITHDALFEVVNLLNAQPDADVIYTDEDKINTNGERFEPFFKPDWSPQYLRSTMYIGHFTVYRKNIVETVGGFRTEFDGSQDYDLALRVSEFTDRICHIPQILYHWRVTPLSTAGDVSAKPWAFNAARRALADHVSRMDIKASVEDQHDPGYYRVRYSIIDNPLVSIVVPTDGQTLQTRFGPRDLLASLLRSIVERTTYKNYELVVVDNGYLSENSKNLVELYGANRIIYKYEEPFSFAAKVNFAVGHALGQHIVLLNDDIEIISPEWLSAMLEYSQLNETGVVGARLLFPDGRLQHTGVVLGIGGGACHIFSGQPHSHPGYFNSSRIIRNFSAVTGACMMTRSEIFQLVGGFDERFATDFNDVDYCLKVREQGYNIVATPFAELIHYEGASFGSRERIVDPGEIALLKERWQPIIDNDPFYNPNLTRTALDYRLSL